MPISVSVIIPVYRDWDRLALCLDALAAQTLKAGEFEVILVNNEPEPREHGALGPNVRLIHEPRPGSYAARNAGVRRSSAPALAFTDSDCVPDPAWLESALAALAEHPEARITGPIDVFRDPGASYYAFVHDRNIEFLQRQYVATGACATANLIVSRVQFDRVGPFREAFSGEDFAWNQRAQAAGIPILFVEGVKVGHPARKDLRAIFNKRRRKAGSRVDTPAYRFVLGRLRPPVRHFARLRRERVRWPEALTALGIHWCGSLVEIAEFSLIRLRLKQPNRS
ncbi:MAG TPA: glycosyltransferase [Allosphingosinicella sp.]|nr:glycosyltransferase [Allosphingosinicella sp.]